MIKDTILYVDDEVFNLETFEANFYKKYKILTCNKPMQAIDIFNENPEIKLLIADQKMSQITGLELINKILEIYPDVICIILTAYAEIDIALKAINQGGIYKFIVKPWQKEDMLITIENAIETYNLRLQNKILMQNINKANDLKNAFLANISHEIRTPLNGIIGFASLICEMELTNSEKNEYFNIIKINSQRLLKIIDNVVEISKAGTDNLKLVYNNFSIRAILDAIINNYKFEIISKNLNINIFYNNEIDEIYIDPVILKNILNNLIDNAIKFTDNGEITISYKLNEANFILFAVKDTGTGISKENIKEVFVPFRQLDFSSTRKYSGNGLGLSLAKAYVKKLGGKIWVESVLGTGSTFFFTIPYKTEVVNSKPTFKFNHKIKKALIAETNNDSIIFLQKIFKDINIQTFTAESRSKITDICLQNPDIDVIIIDLKLPELDTETIIKEIKKITLQPKIIAVTNYVHQEDNTNLIDAGFDFFIEKPFNKNMLISFFSIQ